MIEIQFPLMGAHGYHASHILTHEDCEEVRFWRLGNGRHEEVPCIGLHKAQTVQQELRLVLDMLHYFTAAYEIVELVLGEL